MKHTDSGCWLCIHCMCSFYWIILVLNEFYFVFAFLHMTVYKE